MNREKVIKALEHCIEKLDAVVNKTHGFNCIDCPYFRKCDRSGYLIGLPLMRDALVLLKAQEAEECENTNKARIFCCSVCGYEVGDIFIDERRFEYPSINFCPNCGRAVKWDV